MMVRNEEAYLSTCLSSIKKLADEIIVVDTGSEDRTVDIARMHGAKVYDFRWVDDFAAVRNFSLEKARGDWILILDADETISAKDHGNFIRLLQNTGRNESLAFVMTTRNYTDKQSSADWTPNDNAYPEIQADGWVPTQKVRLFPNRHGIHFVYAVHEVVEPVLKEKGFRLAKCPIPVHHFGKLDPNRVKERWQIYYRIGKKKLDDLGEHPAALRELATQAGLLGRLEEAAELWRRFVAQCPEAENGWTNLANIHSRLRDFKRAKEAAHRAAAIATEKAETLYNVVVSELQDRDIEGAAKAAKRLKNKFPHYAPGHVLQAISDIFNGKSEAGIEQFTDIRNKVGDHRFMQIIVEIAAALRHLGDYGWIMAICDAVQRSKVDRRPCEKHHVTG